MSKKVLKIDGAIRKKDNSTLTSKEKEILCNDLLEFIEKKGYLFLGFTK